MFPGADPGFWRWSDTPRSTDLSRVDLSSPVFHGTEVWRRARVRAISEPKSWGASSWSGNLYHTTCSLQVTGFIVLVVLCFEIWSACAVISLKILHCRKQNERPNKKQKRLRKQDVTHHTSPVVWPSQQALAQLFHSGSCFLFIYYNLMATYKIQKQEKNLEKCHRDSP